MICTLLLRSSLWPVKYENKWVFHLFNMWKGPHPAFVRQLNLQCFIWFCALNDVSPSHALSDLHTPSFLSLSSAPCRKSKETSSFSSSHCITNCSNHLQGSKDSKSQQEEEHPNPMWKLSDVWMLLSMSAVQVLKHTCTSTQANRACTITWVGSDPFLSFFLSFLFLVPSPLTPWEPPLILLHLKALCHFFPSIHMPESSRKTSTATGTCPAAHLGVPKGNVKIGKLRSSFSDGVWQLVPLSSAPRDTHNTKGGVLFFFLCLSSNTALTVSFKCLSRVCCMQVPTQHSWSKS